MRFNYLQLYAYHSYHFEAGSSKQLLRHPSIVALIPHLLLK